MQPAPLPCGILFLTGNPRDNPAAPLDHAQPFAT
jgi:hypothetical protein